MGSLRGPNADTVTGNRDYAQVVMSPRVGGGVTHSPFHPMSRRSLSQKRMGVSESSSLLFKLLKGEEVSPRDAANSQIHNGDTVKGYKSRFGDSNNNAESKYSTLTPFLSVARRNWRHTAFFLCTLLVITLMLLKILYLGVFPIQEKSLQASQVPFC